MITVRINLFFALVTVIILISSFEIQRGVLAIEQKNSTDAETPLSSTQSSVTPLSSSIATSTANSGSIPTSSSSLSPPFSSASSFSVSQLQNSQLFNSQPHSSPKDEIYIDDEGLEGSGGRGEIHDDLEKEPEYSGSGFGPDDEDSTSTTHQRKKGNGGYKSTNIGSGGFKPTNSKNKSQKPILDTKLKKQEEKDDLEETGSGAGNDDEDDNEEDDRDLNVDNDSHSRNSPEEEEEKEEEEEEEDFGRSGSINLNPKITSKTAEDDFTIDFTTTAENTDEISIGRQNPDLDSGISGGDGNEIDSENIDSGTGKPTSSVESNQNPSGNGVLIMDNSNADRTASFFAQPGILAAVIGGAVVGLLCAILVVMFIVYRMRKKDEGSYALDEPKRSPAVNSYAKNSNNREFYA